MNRNLGRDVIEKGGQAATPAPPPPKSQAEPPPPPYASEPITKGFVVGQGHAPANPPPPAHPVHTADYVTPVDETIGRKLRHLRNSNKWTQSYLSEIYQRREGLKVSAERISAFENGARMTPEIIDATCAIFDVSPNYLFGRPDHKPLVFEVDQIEELFGTLMFIVVANGELPTSIKRQVDNVNEIFKRWHS